MLSDYVRSDRVVTDGTTAVLYNIKSEDTAMRVYKKVTPRAQQFYRPNGLEVYEVIIILLDHGRRYSMLLPSHELYYTLVPDNFMLTTKAVVAEIISAENAIYRLAQKTDGSILFITPDGAPAAHVFVTDTGFFSHEHTVLDWQTKTNRERAEYLRTSMSSDFAPGTVIIQSSSPKRKDMYNGEKWLIGDDATATRSDFLHAASKHATAAAPSSSAAAAYSPSSKKHVSDDADLRTLLHSRSLSRWDHNKMMSFFGGSVSTFLPRELSVAQQLLEIRDRVAKVRTPVVYDYESSFGGGTTKRRSQQRKRSKRRSQKRKRSASKTKRYRA
jgi:hypothetical protein